MARLVIVSAFLVVVLAIGAVSATQTLASEDVGFLGEIVVVADVNELLRANPHLSATPMQRSAERGVIRYTAGSRVGGDRLVASGSDGSVWSSNQNVQMSVVYPPAGTGSIVSYVDCLVDQSSNSGNAYIVEGGIGQRRIVMIIEAYNTWHFSYQLQIFGY